MAPAPEEPSTLPSPVELIDPPKRAALPRGVGAPAIRPELVPALHSVEAARVSVPGIEQDTMVMVDDPEDVVIVGDLHNPDLARQLATYMNQLKGESAYTGIFAVVIFALMRQVQVYRHYS